MTGHATALKATPPEASPKQIPVMHFRSQPAALVELEVAPIFDIVSCLHKCVYDALKDAWVKVNERAVQGSVPSLVRPFHDRTRASAN